jgi:putative hydrolase of the HAD superfamily
MLDMGGVLTLPQRLDKVDELIAILGLERPREAFLEAYFAERLDYDRGEVDGLEYWRRLTASFGLAFREADLPELVDVDLQCWFNMRPAMLDFLGGAKERVGRLVLLSNVHADGVNYLRRGPGRAWAAGFDELVLSCEHRLLKPELEIYDLALDMAGALPSETLFIDDNLDNVEGAKRAGMSSFRFIGEEDFALRLERDFELIH